MNAPVVDENSLDVGDDVEERGSSGGKDLSNQEGEKEETSRMSFATSLVESLKSTVESAAGSVPASLAGSVGRSESSHNDVEKAASQLTGGDTPARADKIVREDLSLESTVAGSGADERSVDRRPEQGEGAGDMAPLESQAEIVHEEEEMNEVEGQHLSMQGQSSASSDVTPEPEIQEEDSYSIGSPSGHLADSRPYVSSSSLRRRPRSFVKGDAYSSQVSESGDISVIAENQAAFQPQGDTLAEDEDEDLVSRTDNSNELGSGYDPEVEDGDNGPRSFVKGDAYSSQVSESGDISVIAENQAAFLPQGDILAKDEDEDLASRTDNSNELGSGYDPEVEDGDNDASSVSSREANDAVNSLRRSAAQPEDGWEEISSSSPLAEIGPTHESRPRREVYRMPGSDDEGEENGREPSPQLLAEPAGFMVQAVEFQLNLIVHMIAMTIWLTNFTLSTLSNPISRTVAVTDRVTNVTAGAANQVLEVFSFLGDGVSQAGPTMGKLSKKTFRGFFRVAYVICILGLLLIPALFVDIVIVNTLVHEPVVIRHALHFDFTEPKPVAVLPIFSKKEMERIESIPAHKTVKTRKFSVGSKFHITVSLTLPESDYNLKLGMFQVTAETLSARDKVILRSSKPSRLRFRSGPFQLVNSLIYAVPTMVGLVKEEQTLQIRLLEGEEKVVPTASVRITLEPKASEGYGLPEIYEASVRLESTLPWSRALMRSWKWLFFIWNWGCLFLFEVGIILCCCRGLLIPSFGMKSVVEGENVQGEAVTEKQIVQGEFNDERATRDGTKSSKRARSSRRVYFEDGVPGSAGTQDRRITRLHKHQEKGHKSEGITDVKHTPA